MVILDTNIIIDHLRQKTGETILIKLAKEHVRENLGISILTIQELYEGQSTKIKQNEEKLLSVISPLRILSYSYEIATRAGMLARDLGRPISLADAGIASTCLVNQAKLATLNQKDFVGIKGLELVKVT